MTELAPNTPAKRLQFIAKTYEKKPYLVFEMIDIIGQTVGEDNWRYHVGRAATADPKFEADWRLYKLSPDARLADLLEVGDPPTAYLHAVVALVMELPGFQGRHPAEGMFPWMATQLAKGLSAAQRAIYSPAGSPPPPPLAGYSRSQYTEVASTFRQKGTALGQWFVATRPDLTKLSFADAMTAFEEWEEEQEEQEDVPQGEIVHEFGDGYTIQELETREQLDAEGKVMQHCVGSYYQDVRNGQSTIYSLRDPKGRPHVTIEFDPDLHLLKQVKGKQNDDPTPKYQAYVDKFLASDSVPQMDARTKAIYDALVKRGDDDGDPAYLRSSIYQWNEEFGSDAADWIGMGFYDIDEASSLRDADITLDELAEWPGVFWNRFHKGDLYRSGRTSVYTVDAFARLTKIATMISKSDRDSTAIGRAMAQSKQTAFEFATEEPKTLEKLANESQWDWEFSDYRGELTEWGPIVVHAERWADTELKLDDIEEWYKRYFTPDEAVAWDYLDVYPEVALVLRAERVTPAQVEEAIDDGRIRNILRLQKGDDADAILHALGLTPNRGLKRNTTGLLTAYHGTSSSMAKPTTFKAFRGMDFGPGFYLATTADEAAKYGSRVYEAQVQVKNPILLSNTSVDQTLVAWFKRNLHIEDRDLAFYKHPLVGVFDLFKIQVEVGAYKPSALVTALQKKGYDGIYVESDVISAHHTSLTTGGDYLVVWQPAQILHWRLLPRE